MGLAVRVSVGEPVHRSLDGVIRRRHDEKVIQRAVAAAARRASIAKSVSPHVL
jgi:hypothetical protein